MKRSGFRSLLALALTLAMLLSTLLAPVALAEESLWGDNEWSEETYADMGDDEGVDLGEVTEDYVETEAEIADVSIDYESTEEETIDTVDELDTQAGAEAAWSMEALSDGALFNSARSKAVFGGDEGLELDWVEADATVGRITDGWWVGMKFTAPNATIAQSALYSVNGGDRAVFYDSRDGDDWMGAWILVNEEKVENALEETNGSLNYTFAFYDNAQDETAETFTVSINVKNLRLNKDGDTVFKTVDGKIIDKITIQFVASGVDYEILPQEVFADETLVRPRDPEKQGTHFMGWYYEDDDGQEQLWSFADLTPATAWSTSAESHTLTAKWGYTVYADYNGGQDADELNNLSTIVEENTTCEEPEVSRDGMELMGWYYVVSPEGEELELGDEFEFSTPINEDTRVMAVWGCVVTFDANGGPTAPEAQIVEEGQCAEWPEYPDPDRTGYWFWGWSTVKDDPDGDYTFDFDTPITSKKTLYAQWTLRYVHINFDSLGGQPDYIGSQMVDYGTKAEKFANPTKKGYTFVGWFDEDGKAFDFDTPVTTEEDHIDLTARWAINAHTITFDTDGGSAVAAFKADYGTLVKAPADPTKAGYTFTGWDKAIPETMPDEDVTVKAKWKVNQYTITFDTDGGSKIDPIKADFGAKVTKPADPTKTGYTFDGWEPALPETMPAENLTVKAKWKVNQYTITFDTDGGSKIDPIKADFGAKVTKPADPTKDGYTFDGWEPALPETMPAEDLTVKAKWTAVVLKGWKQDGGKWYYYDNGVMATGWKKINGNWFRFTASGVMQTGWQQIGKWYYFNPNGRMATGWQKISGVQYYFNGDGAMRTGWQNIEGKWYFFNNKGALQTGWQKLNDIWYHFADGGEMQTGWQKIGGLWYYFNLNGRMQTGWQNLGGKWYYLNPKGAMVTGWLKLGQTWYYLDENGAMITGWLKLGTKWYYLKANGAMVTGTQTINGKTYTFDANGAWVS